MGRHDLLDRKRFLDEVSDRRYADSLARIFDSCERLGLRLAWGTTGASIRVATVDMSEPLSIGWIFDAAPRWYGLSGLNLGVDPWSSKLRPSTKGVIEEYTRRVSCIPGVERAKSGKLCAFALTPSLVVARCDWVIEALAYVAGALISARAEQ